MAEEYCGATNWWDSTPSNRSRFDGGGTGGGGGSSTTSSTTTLTNTGDGPGFGGAFLALSQKVKNHHSLLQNPEPNVKLKSAKDRIGLTVP